MATPQDTDARVDSSSVPLGISQSNLSTMERGYNRCSSMRSTMTAKEVKVALANSANPLSNVDAELLDLLAQWDTTGDGQYSVEEVLLIARTFQQKQRQVRSLIKTLITGAILVVLFVTATLFVSLQADEMSKDIRPNKNGILTTTDGKTAGVAEVVHRSELEIIPFLTDEQFARLQFVSFELQGDNHFLMVAGAARRSTQVHTEHGDLPVVDVFFVSGIFAKLTIGHDITVSYTNGTSVVVDNGVAEKRRLSSESLSKARGVGMVGIAGVDISATVMRCWRCMRKRR